MSSYQFAGDIGGFYYLETTVQPNGDPEAIKIAIEEELSRFLKDGPTKAELRRAKMKLKSSFVRGLEKVGGFGGKSDILAQNTVYTGNPGHYKKSLNALDEATPKKVLEIAKIWLKKGSYNLEIHPIKSYDVISAAADRSKIP